MMKRRAFIAGLGSAVPAWPLAARAQQSAMPVIGWLGTESPGSFENAMRAFRQGLSQSGYIEGRNVTIEFRWAEGQVARLSGLAADLARRPVALIVTHGPGALAAKAATTTIPIVFLQGVIPSR